MRIRDALTLACALAFLASCGGKDADKGGKAPPPKDGGHEDHAAAHGGEILELGEEAAHLELVHDRAGATVTVYVLDKDVKTPVATEAPVVMIKTATGPQEFTLMAVNPRPDGTADTWKGSHPGLGSDPLEGRIRVKVRGTSYQSPLEVAPHGP